MIAPVAADSTPVLPRLSSGLRVTAPVPGTETRIVAARGFAPAITFHPGTQCAEPAAWGSYIDAAAAVPFKAAMRSLVETPTPRVVLDMSKVTMIDSSGLGAIVSAMKHLGPDRPLELSGLTEHVAAVFKLTRMDSVFTIHDSPEAATEGFRHAS